MARLIDYRLQIIDSNPYHQGIELSLQPAKWINLNNNIINEVLTGLHTNDQQNKYIITRDDVRNSHGRYKIVRALMWAFADKPDLRIVRSVLNHFDEIVSMLDITGSRNLTRKQYEQLYNRLDDISYVGTTTASVLFFFSQIKCEGNHSIAVTGQIIPLFSVFEEFGGFNKLGYIGIVERVNEIAREMDVSTEQIEYFLYRVNKGEIQI